MCLAFSSCRPQIGYGSKLQQSPPVNIQRLKPFEKTTNCRVSHFHLQKLTKKKANTLQEPLTTNQKHTKSFKTTPKRVFFFFQHLRIFDPLLPSRDLLCFPRRTSRRRMRRSVWRLLAACRSLALYVATGGGPTWRQTDVFFFFSKSVFFSFFNKQEARIFQPLQRFFDVSEEKTWFLLIRLWVAFVGGPPHCSGWKTASWLAVQRQAFRLTQRI